MRISDWSSDVCSSDLQSLADAQRRAARISLVAAAGGVSRRRLHAGVGDRRPHRDRRGLGARHRTGAALHAYRLVARLSHGPRPSDSAAQSMNASLRGLYAITPDALVREPARLLDAFSAAVSGGAQRIQYRDKCNAASRSDARRWGERGDTTGKAW